MQLWTMIDKDRLLTDGTVISRTVVEFAPGKGHACIMTLISTGEMAAQRFAYHAHGTANSDKSHGLCAMTKH